MAFTRRVLGDHFNEGARLLWLALENTKQSVREVDRVAGTTSAVGSSIRWLYGDGRPNTGARVKLQERFGVPILAWDEAATEGFVLPALRTSSADDPSAAAGPGADHDGFASGDDAPQTGAA